MSIIDTLIFDRSPADTAQLEALFAKAKAGTLTAAERITLNTPSHKGAYNYTDLARVSAAARYLVQLLDERGYVAQGYTPDDTSWTKDTIPTRSQLRQYAVNIKAIRNTLATMPTTPKAPADMELLTADEANAIERILYDCDLVLSAMEPVYLHAQQPLLFSGFSVYISHAKATKTIYLAVYTADGKAVYTADGMAVMTTMEVTDG